MGVDVEMVGEAFDGHRWRWAVPVGGPPGPREEGMAGGMTVGRNRALFAILGRGDGYAHSETAYRPIAPPRGLPVDPSDELAGYLRRDDPDPFGHSWLALAELLAFDWRGQTVQKSAMVDPKVAPIFADNPVGFPIGRWPKGEPVAYSESSVRGVRVRWRETYEESAGAEFLGEVIPRLQAAGPADRMRLVFWFDA